MSESSSRTVTIGSRESALAVTQAQMVIDFLSKAHPELDVLLATMKTTGDKILDRRLDQVGGKGLFVKELDAALAEGRTDFSVHSCKDLPMEIAPELPLMCFSAREDPRDALVFAQGATEPDFSLPIGTSSPRRELQLRTLYPQARFESIRGNVQTRLRKLDGGRFGAVVLAAAGLRRLGLADRIGALIDVHDVIPAAGQGILAIQGRADAVAQAQADGLFEDFANGDAQVAALVERAFVARLDGGCSSPIAAHLIVQGDSVELLGLYCDEDTGHAWRGSITGQRDQAMQMARQLADHLKNGDGEEI